MTIFSSAAAILTSRGGSAAVRGAWIAAAAAALVQKVSASISTSANATATIVASPHLNITNASATLTTSAQAAPYPPYGALIALIGLGAVAFLVVRKHTEPMNNFDCCPDDDFRDCKCDNPHSTDNSSTLSMH